MQKCNGCGKEIKEKPIADMVNGFWHKNCAIEASWQQSEARRLKNRY